MDVVLRKKDVFNFFYKALLFYCVFFLHVFYYIFYDSRSSHREAKRSDKTQRTNSIKKQSFFYAKSFFKKFVLNKLFLFCKKFFSFYFFRVSNFYFTCIFMCISFLSCFFYKKHSRFAHKKKIRKKETTIKTKLFLSMHNCFLFFFKRKKNKKRSFMRFL
jgi:hypothetical protein